MAPMSLIMAELTGGRIAIEILMRRLGLIKCAGALAEAAAALARGEPWKALGPPEDRKEALSRRQIGSAVLLDRSLRKIMDPEEARELTSEIVRLASIDFLKRNVPVMKRNRLLGKSESQQKAYLRRIKDKFFNADADMAMEGTGKLYLTVRRCRFVELLGAVGEKSMAPLFCKGDEEFFDKHQPQTLFTRPETLSRGGRICDFQFNWIDK